MALYGPTALAFFDELKALDPLNAVCIDCGAHNPLWASLSYGSYFCLECSGAHRSIGVHISFVRSLNMDSWNEQQQARMRAGGNTRLRDYLRACGMPEDFSTRGAACVREKYHTESAAAYRSHLEKVARGEASELKPVPFELAPPPAAAAPSGTTPSRRMDAFGSQPVEEDGGGLDALISSFSVLSSKTFDATRSATASVTAAALPKLSSVVETAKGVVGVAKGQMEAYATFDAKRDLQHLSAHDGEAGEAHEGAAAPTDESTLGWGLSTVSSGASWLWGAAQSTVQKATTFDAALDLEHLKRPAAGSSEERAGAAPADSGGRTDGWGAAWDDEDGWDESHAAEGAPQASESPLREEGDAQEAIGAGETAAGSGGDGDGWGDGWEAEDAAHDAADALPPAAAPREVSPSSGAAPPAADGWGDGWDDDGWDPAVPPATASASP
ncbi:hypothetical protein AB1Y20_021741 [Prymnesium parvum]|uniref:Arf-GAP domain-containing protein n=1 Tax=Prymnesium parvum TaxID=97485 RepID=A0AB34JME8_PRYPA